MNVCIVSFSLISLNYFFFFASNLLCTQLKIKNNIPRKKRLGEIDERNYDSRHYTLSKTKTIQ
jgi:hypothetical protein